MTVVSEYAITYSSLSANWSNTVFNKDTANITLILMKILTMGNRVLINSGNSGRSSDCGDGF